MAKINILRAFVLVFYLLSVSISYSQIKNKDLEAYKKKFPNDDLLVLLKKEIVRIGIDESSKIFIKSKHFKEKLYLNSNAINYARESIPYSDFYKIKKLNAKTIIGSKNKYKEIPVEEFRDQDVIDDAIFSDDSKSKNFIYPSMQSGAITKLNYEIDIVDPRFLNSYFFSSFDPMERCELIIEVDNRIDLAFEYFNIDEKDLNYNKIQKGNNIVHTWTNKNVSKIKFEEGAPNVKYYVPHLVAFVKSYNLNGDNYKILSSVRDLYNWYWGFVDHLDKEDTRELATLVDSLVRDKDSDLQKVESVYSWVQKNIKYIAFEKGFYGFIPRNASQVYAKRYGDCKDMANVIRSLLKLVGIESYLTWVGTRDIPYSYSQIPTPATDNHMIATYIENGNYYFMDATNQHVPFGLPSSFIQGKEALIGMGKNKFQIVKIPEIGSTLNSNIDSINIVLKGNTLIGDASSYLTGYNSEYLKESLGGLTKKDKENVVRKFYKKGNGRFNLLHCEIKESNKSVEINYKFELDNYAKFSGKEVFINPHMDKVFENGTIELNRNLSIEKGYKSFTKKVVSIKIPKYYTVTFIPENKYFDSKDFGFALVYRYEGDEIVLTQELYFNLLVMSKEKFPEWNKMVQLLKGAYNEVVSLQLNQKP